MKRISAKLHFKSRLRFYTFVFMTTVFSLFCIALIGGASTVQAYTSLPDPLSSGACLGGGCVIQTVGGDGASITDAYVAGGNGTGIIPYMESLFAGADTGTTAAIATDSGAGALEAAGVGVGLVTAPAAITILGGAALTIGAVALEKKFHIGSSITSYFADFKANSWTDNSTNAVPIQVGAWVADVQTAVGGFEPHAAGWPITGSNRSGGRNAVFPASTNIAAMQAAGCSLADASEAAHANAMQGITWVAGVGTVCGAPTESGYIPSGSAYDGAFTKTTAPWTGQTVDQSDPWPNLSTGAGLEPKPGQAPVPSGTSLGTSDPPAYCTQSGLLACPNLNNLQNLNTASKNQLRCQVDPSGFGCPTQGGGTFSSSGGRTTTNYVVPGCEGMTINECEIALNQIAVKNNWSAPAFTTVTSPVTSANPNYGPGAVIRTSPQGGATVSANTDFTITTNPSTLPQIIPFPRPWETYLQYQARLNGQGVATSIATATLANTPSTIGPNEVVSVSPTPGTTVDPTTTTVTITRGNPSAPFPAGDPNDPSVITGPGGCACGTISFPNVALGSAFPFGIFTWLNSVYSGFTGAGACPSVDFNRPSVMGGGTQAIPFCNTTWETTYRPVVFPILEFLMTLAAIWFFAFRVIGIGGG